MPKRRNPTIYPCFHRAMLSLSRDVLDDGLFREFPQQFRELRSAVGINVYARSPTGTRAPRSSSVSATSQQNSTANHKTLALCVHRILPACAATSNESWREHHATQPLWLQQQRGSFNLLSGAFNKKEEKEKG